MMRWRHPLITAGLALLLIAGTVFASPSPQSAPLEQLVLDARLDLEVLADVVLSAGSRPQGWNGSADIRAATVVNDLWFDNELLANVVFGDGLRPDDWIGATAPIAPILARNVRHDLELTADQVLGSGQRPETWRGGPPVLRCSRNLQNVLTLLTTFYDLQTTVSPTSFNYCAAIAADIEDELNNIYFGTQIGDQPLPDPIALIVATRGDLERLADERLGLNTRPDSWLGNRDAQSSTLINDVFIDLQRLADALLGINVRPDGWLATPGSTPQAAYFFIRHDLELLADVTLAPDTRPTGWQGMLPLARCLPLEQQLIFITTVQYGLSLEAIDPRAVDFCAQAVSAANLRVENPPIVEAAAEEEGPRETLWRSENAFAYLDVAATQYMGIMPEGTEFRALYRNFNESTMMFVAGEDFALYIDQRWTNLPEPIYRRLQTLEGVRPIAFCNAYWCSGPGPTPTPTGGGPLVALLIDVTPGAPPPDAQVISGVKTQVSWTNVRVTYVADNATTRSAQVTLEVCEQRADIASACEPVTRVFDNATGTERPVIGLSNGLIIEAATRFSTDVWISDPTIR